MSACADTGKTGMPTQPVHRGCLPINHTSTSTASSRLPSAQGSWPTFHGNLSRDGALPGGEGGTLKLAWSYCSGGPLFSSPIVDKGGLYIASTNTTLTALDARSGRMRWQLRGDGPFFSTPALQDNVLYACSLGGSLYALDTQTGSMRWHVRVPVAGAQIWSSPVLAQGLLIVGLASTLSEKPKIAGQVLALDLRTGKQRWSAAIMPHNAPGGGVWSSPAVDIAHGIVYAATGDPDDGVQAFSLRDGARLWHWRSVTRDVADTDVGAGPTLYRDRSARLRIAVGGKDGWLYSLDARSGQMLWSTRVGKQVYSSPAVANGTLYAVGVSGRSAIAWSLDGDSGQARWHHAIPVMVYSSPVVAGRTLYVAIGNGFGPGDGGVEVLDTTNGQQLQYADRHSTLSSSPALLSSWLFVGAQDGNLYAFTR